MKETLLQWIDEQKTHGADEALLWAGQMSTAISSICNASAVNLSSTIEWAIWIKTRYDAVIYERAMSKS